MNSKFLILAVIATMALATPWTYIPPVPPGENNCWADEEECLYQACIPEVGNCFYSNGANPFDGCRTIQAGDCKDQCYNDCYYCVSCLWNFGCCTAGDLVEEVPLCEAACNILSIPQNC